MPSVSALARSLPRPSGPATPVAVSTHAFSRSVQEPQTRITPPIRRAPPGQERGHPPSSSRRKYQAPRFRCHLKSSFDASTTTPHRDLPGRALLERLPGPHLAGSSPAFSLDARHDSLQLTQLQGGFGACPHRADAGGPAILHLSHSTAYLQGLLHGSSFGVRDARYCLILECL
jgi:hypothetical protein